MNQKNTKQIILIVTYAMLLAFALFQYDKIFMVCKYLISVVFPLIIGGCIAFILNVPMSSIEQKLFGKVKNKKVKKMARPLSILITILLLCAVIAVVLLIVIPEIGNTMVILIDNLKAFPNKILEFMEKYDIDQPKVEAYIKNINIDWESLVKSVFSFAKNGFGSVFNSTFSIISSVISSIMSGFIGFIFAIYILSQKEKLGIQGTRIVKAMFKENRAQRILSVLKRTSDTFASFIRGQCIEAVILGSMFFVTLSIVRFKYAVLIGVLIAVTALIPIFGAFIGCVVGAFLYLMDDPIKAVWFVIIFFILQQIEGNLIYPHVVGGSVGLPSIWVLAAVTVGGNLFGIAGMLFFIPLVSVLYALFREYICEKEAKRVKVEVVDEDNICL